MHKLSITNIFVHNCATDNLQEVCIKLTGYSSSKKSLSGTRWTIQETTLGWHNSYSHEKFWIEQWKFNNFPQFSDLFTKTSDVRVGNISRILVTHVVNQRINFSRQIPN